MFKKIVKFLLVLAAIAAAVYAFLAWRKKKEEVEDDEFSDIFEDEDFDSEDDE